jgi:dTDP-4-dehydrorhamnose 3,5-epimerase-like enzyme
MHAPRLIQFPKFAETRGSLSFIEGGNHVPFIIERVFYLYDVPGGQTRDAHAHKTLEQCYIPLSGAFEVVLDDASGHPPQRYRMNRADEGLYVPPGFWRELRDFTSGAVCLCLASASYDPQDYIRDYDDFLKWKRAR